MKIKIKDLYRKKIFRLGIFPLLLLVLWLVLTFFYIITFDTSLTVISSNHSKESFDKVTYNKLIKGERISGSFTATENNLGIVSVKFQTFIRSPYKDEDHLVFRFKEKGASKWYAENTYRDGLIYDVPFFPFGFPKIADSKGRKYQFEVQSLNGNEINSVALSKKGQVLFSKYQVSKTLLLHNKKEFAVFIYKKFMSSMLSLDVKFSSFIYLLPFIFYCLWISPLKKNTLLPAAKNINSLSLRMRKKYPYKLLVPILKLIKQILLYELDSLIIIVVLVDIFMIQLKNDVMYIIIAALWLITLKAYKLDSRKSFLAGIFILLLPPILLSFRDEPTAEKAAIWAFVFLVAGTIQLISESKQKA